MANVFNFKTLNEYENYVLEKANDFLDMCEIYKERDDREHLIDNIKMSIESKQWIFNILSNCEGWNGKGQVVLPVSFERPISEREIDRFSEFLYTYQKRILKDVVFDINNYIGTYKEMKDLYNQYRDYVYYIDCLNLDYQDVIIKGKPLSFYNEERSTLLGIIRDIETNSDYKRIRGSYVTHESEKEYKLAKLARDMIEMNNHKFITSESTIDEINNSFGIRISSGVKTTRAVLKMIKATRLYAEIIKNEEDEKEFNRAYSRYCDAINPLSIKKWTVISVNFVDYLTMSYGYKWTSCLNTDKNQRLTRGMWGDGFNSRRTLDYALDPSTIVFYTIDSDYAGDDFELQPKETRQLFHFNGSRLIQSRLYPQGDDSRSHLYTQNREIIEKVLTEGMGVPNLWSAPTKGIIYIDDDIVSVPYEYHSLADYIDFLSIACHGSDEREFQDQVNYVTLKGTGGGTVEIGSIDAVDIVDGSRLPQDYTTSITTYYTW